MYRRFAFRSQCSLGTYTGHYEPVKAMSDLLDAYEEKTGHFVPIHGSFPLIMIVVLIFIFPIVDAASGGFIAPFVTVIHAGLL